MSSPTQSWLDLLDHWQSLAAGLVAVFAAIIAIGGAELFARLKERRERKAILLSLAAEVRLGISLCIGALRTFRWISESSSVLMFGPDLRARVELPPPIVFPASADRIGLLGPQIAAGLTEFYAGQEALNRAVRIATTAPSAPINKTKIEELTLLFEQACRLALPLLVKLPHEEADAMALKKTIESFAEQSRR
jgi:hypothetical protein